MIKADPANRSLLLRIPAAARYAFNTRRFNWNYASEPEPHFNGRRLLQSRGKVLGGSRSINGMAYLRGLGFDYQAWLNARATGWNYAQLQPYIKSGKMKRRRSPLPKWRRADKGIRARTGNPITEGFLESGKLAKYEVTGDVNGFGEKGLGRFPMHAADGYRWFTARAYLWSAAQRGSL
ncbi:MAG: GMC family oxidoreductase N-terminal domain-containing protein [Albidovulum sp.]|nr:GMC family oxidoreductase N-terminal domain-containing protein [Albidovulum sp.]